MENNKPVTKPDSEESKIEGSASLDVSRSEILKSLIEAYGKNSTNEKKKQFAELLSKRLKQQIARHNCSESYNVIIIFDNTILLKSDSDRIYQAISSLTEKTKPLLMILVSNGGEPGSAYLIGKLCRESCNGKFLVVVPRYAKSAATLLATAANEIHMGSLSELGPIDPQINKMPTLGLKNSIEHITELVNKAPGSAEMFARYLSRSIAPIQIGYYERVAESAAQYAERLLDTHKESLGASSKEIARKLVYDYKDHGFVIDKTEALDIFGEKVIKSNSLEYQLGNDIYLELSAIEEIADILGYNFYFIGSPESDPGLAEKKK